MSRDIKIVLIVFGTLVGLALVALVSAIALWKVGTHVSESRADESALVAARIASFRLPAGYDYTGARSNMFYADVYIAPHDAQSSDFTIELEAFFLPNLGSEGKDDIVENLRRDLGPDDRCKGAEFDGYDTVPRRDGKTIDLAVVECDVHSKAVRMIEYGAVPGNYPTTIVLASGSRRAFDRPAVEALIGSLR